MARHRRWAGVVTLAALAVVVVGGGNWLGGRAGSPDDVAGGDEARVLALFESRSSGEVVVVAGTADRILADDNAGSRHQRFILRLASGHTLLVAHNIDLAPRVPLSVGDVVTVRGEYEWNELGGVLHWTHHDPDGQRAGGWIEFDRERYR